MFSYDSRNLRHATLHSICTIQSPQEDLQKEGVRPNLIRQLAEANTSVTDIRSNQAAPVPAPTPAPQRSTLKLASTVGSETILKSSRADPNSTHSDPPIGAMATLREESGARGGKIPVDLESRFSPSWYNKLLAEGVTVTALSSVPSEKDVRTKLLTAGNSLRDQEDWEGRMAGLRAIQSLAMSVYASRTPVQPSVSEESARQALLMDLRSGLSEQVPYSVHLTPPLLGSRRLSTQPFLPVPIYL